MTKEIFISICDSVNAQSSRRYRTMRIKNSGYKLFMLSLALLTLMGLLAVHPMPFYAGMVNAEPGTATASDTTLTLSTTASDTSVTLIPGAGFSLSNTDDTAAFGITSSNFTGYSISLAAADDAQTLINTDDSSYTISSISNPVEQSSFVTTNSTLTNRWGIKPNKYYDAASSTTVANTTTILPAPTTDGTMLDVTSAANSTANNYSIALGAMVNGEKPAGTYVRATTLTATANPIYYTLNFDKNTSDTVTNLPSTQTGSTTATSITIPTGSPERANYTFLGYCEVATTTTDGVDACSGTIYQPGDDFGIDQTTENTTTLRAMWKIKSYAITYGTVTGIASVSLGGTSCSTALSGGGCTKNLTYGETYDLVATEATGYSFSSWDAGDYGTITDTSDAGASTTYTVGAGASTITPVATANEYEITFLGSEITTGMENTSYTLTTLGDGTDFRPVVTSDRLALSTDTTYVLSYDYIADVDGDKAHTDLYPDTLPDYPFSTSTTAQHQDRSLSSSSSDMGAAKIRFFDDVYHTTIASSTTISNIMFSIPDIQTRTYGNTLGALPALSKTGFTFVGWFTEPGGNGTQITSSTAVPAKDTTYYAHWTTNTYTVTYGTVTGISSVTLDGTTCTKALSAGGCTQTFPYGKNYELSAEAATGYTFSSWDAGSNGEIKDIAFTTYFASYSDYATEYLEYRVYSKYGTSYIPTRFKVLGATTITPVATPNEYDITIKPTTGISKVSLNGTECTNTSGCVVSGLTYGNSYALVATAATGYTFSSWANSTSYGTIGSTSTASTTFTVGASATTLTASATANKYTMTFLAGEINTGLESTAKALTTTVGGNKPILQSNVLNLATNTTYVISFDHVSNVENNLATDLYPDSLPQKDFTSYTTKQHIDWSTSSTSSDMSSCRLRFFDDREWNTYAATTTISNIMLSIPTTQTKTYGTTFGTLPSPTKSGFTFNGWYTGPGGTGTKLTTTTSVPAANTTYYGYWTASS